VSPLELALLFHETYERLAPTFGYETRVESRAFDPTSKNGLLMIAVCTELLSRLGVQGGIWLLSDETDLRVLMERVLGEWIEVICVPYQIDGVISHIVESAGIEHCLATKKAHALD